MPVGIVVCASHPVVLEGLRTILDTAPSLTVRRAVDTPSSSLAACRSLRPDVVVADLAATSTTTSATTGWADVLGRFAGGPARARESPPGGRLLTSTTGPLTPDADEDRPPPVVAICDADPGTAAGLLEAGALGVLTPDSDGGQLIAAVQAAARGYVYLPPELTGHVIELLRRRSTGVEDGLRTIAAALTRREREVLLALARGNSPQETATQLFITPATVRTHIYRLRQKVAARDRAELVSFAFRAGLVAGAPA